MPAIKTKVKSFTLSDIRNKASGLGVIPGKLNKMDLIHTIQIAEGNTPCYGKSNNGQCPYTDCCFRKDCFKIKV